MTRVRIAAVDQGSSSTKGAVFDEQGRVLALTRSEIGVVRDGAHVEHDPEEIAASVESALAELAARAGPLAAIGLGVQRSSCLLWERASGEPLSPVLSWQDRRHARGVEAAAADFSEAVRRTSGLFLSPHYAAPKLRGLLDESLALRARAERGEIVAGTLDAWLVHRLTGVPSTEPGIAGRTLLYDLDRDAWSEPLCAAFDIPAAALPALLPSVGGRGEWQGVPVVALAGDQQAALVGHGGWREGVVAVHFGTGAFVLAATGRAARRHPGLLTAVLAASAGERRFQIEGTVQSAGSALDWACGLSGVELDELPPQTLAPESLPLLVPAFVGLGAPWWRPRARARIEDLELATSAEDLVAATLVGVAQRVADNVEAMREAGVRVEVLRASGRLSRRDDLGALLAELTRCTVEIAAAEEAGLAGTARLALAALVGDAGRLGEPPAARCRFEPCWEEPRQRAARQRWRGALARAGEAG
jgi:glycerol kinase